MLRVTVELVPYGVEEMSKTIVEVCVANVHTDAKNEATYAAAGYHDRYGHIEDFGVVLREFPRNDGVLELLKKLFAADRVDVEEILLGEELMKKTRLYAEIEKEIEK